MFRRAIVILIVVLALALPAFSQGGNVTIEPDLRLFATMAALNAAGFDVELASQYHPVREAVREYTKTMDPDLAERLRTFYKSHKGNETDGAQLPKYISLAVSLSDPPELKPTVREELLPPDARSVAGFADLVREYYEKGDLARRWAELEPQYRRAIDQLGPELRDLFVKTDVYMRVPLGRVLPRRLSIFVELAAPVNTVNFRSYQDNFFVILGPLSGSQFDQVRHAYLHYHLDNLVVGYLTRIDGGNALLNLVSRAEGVDPLYVSEFRVMVTESLIRAMEVRMDRMPATKAKEAIDMYYRSGLLLAPYFYQSLMQYQDTESGSIRDYFAEMVNGIRLKTEQQRFQQTFNQIPIPQRQASRPEVPQAPPAPPPNPTRDLLKEAEAAFNAKNIAKAKEDFEKVLSDFDRNNGPAFYGLALIASQEGNREQAQQYFERTIASDSAEPSMRVWSYIFLARIFDLDCKRDRALEYYQQAVKVGDNTRNAQSTAREGLSKSYGDACK